MKLTIKTENGQKVVDLKNDLQFNTLKGEQYVFSNGFSNYILNFKDNQESVILTFNVDGKSIKVELNGIVPLLQANTASMTNPTAIIINKDANDKDINNIVENSNFDGGEIIDRLEALLSKPVELGNTGSSNLTLITDYQTLLESLGAAAAGAEAGGNATGNGSTFNSIFSITDGGLNDIAATDRWVNLTESISTLPVETADTIAGQITSPKGEDSAVLDTTATPAPTVVITEDANNDGLISKAELDGKVDVTITVPTEANVGDTLNVKNPDGTTTTVEITADIKTNGYKTSYDAPAEGGTITVSATITDIAGNTSPKGEDSAVLDTTATPAPTVEITEDKNNDGLISKAELDGKVDVTIKVPTEANVGDTLNVTNPDGTTTTVEITADIKDNGYKTSYDAPAEGGKITVSATITDKAGNISLPGSDTATLDTTPPATPTLTMSMSPSSGFVPAPTKLETKEDGDNVYLEITTLSDGSYVVTWRGIDTNGSYSIFVQKFNANGTTTGNTPVTLKGIPTGYDKDPQITALANGEYVVTWTGGDSIFVQKFNANGTITENNPVTLEGIPTGYDFSPQITALANGEYVVTWTGVDTNGSYSIFVQKFNANGTITGNNPVTPEGIPTGDDYSPQITALANGEYVVTWAGSDVNGDNSIFVQKFNANGTTTGNTPVTLEGIPTGYDEQPQITTLSDGSYVVTWTGEDTNGSSSIFVQKFNANGTITENNPVTLKGIPTGDDYSPQITALANGEYAVTWFGHNGVVFDSVFIQQFDANGIPVNSTTGDLKITTTFNLGDFETMNGYKVTYTQGSLTVDGRTYATGSTVAQSTWETAVANGTVILSGVNSTTYNLIVETTATDAQTGATITLTDTKMGSGMVSPMMLDLDGNGVNTSSIDNGVIFDVNADGKTEQTGWSDGKDGLLVLDLNKDGIINDGNELFGEGTTLSDGSKAKDAFEALKQYDENGDDVIDANDSIFASLQIWVDKNIDGKTNSGELYKLEDLNVKSLDLNSQNISSVDNGNIQGLVSNWTDTNDNSHEMVDVWFKTQEVSQNTISDTATLDTTATPAPTVVITEDVNNDGLISKAELDGKVDVTITVPTEANVGDTLNVKNPDGTTTTVEITADIKTNGYKTSYDAPAEGGTITVSATITDIAGNTSPKGEDSAVLKLNVAPTINDITVSVSEEGLLNGIKDTNGTSDTTDKAIITGTMSITDANNDAITVTLIAPTTELKSNGQNVLWTGTNTNELIGKIGTTEVIKVSIDNLGNYKVELLAPVTHPKNSREDVISLNIGVKASDGVLNTTGTLVVNIEDDMPSVETSTVVWTQATNIPNIFAGDVSFTGSGGNKSSYSFANGAVTVTGRGFSSSTDLTLKSANLSQNSGGLGVASSSSPYHNVANEVDFRKTADGQAASEELIIKLEDGKISYGAKINFAFMYGGELEVGVAEFYRGGVLVSTQAFSSNASSGNYAANFEVLDGGFDKIIIKATDNGNSFSIKDNSDFAVTGVQFLGTTSVQPISYAEGTISYGFGADGAGKIGFTSVGDTVKLANGTAVTMTVTDNSIIGKDVNGNLIFQVQLTPATGKWEFYKYKDFSIGDGIDGILDINYRVVDADGDGLNGSIKIGVDNFPVAINETNNVVIDSANTKTNIVITLDVSGSMKDNNKLSIAKQSIENIIKKYDQFGDVNVKVVTFSSIGTAKDWMSAENAIKYVNGLTAGNGTNYEDAVYKTYNNYSEPVGDQTVAYFISDGAPTLENNSGNDQSNNVGTDSENGWLDTTYRNDWNNFVETKVDKLFVLGIGSGITNTSYLEVLADAGNTDTIIVTDPNNLNSTLINTVAIQKIVNGDVLDNVSGGDGIIKINSIEVNGTTYNASNYTNSNNTVTIDNWQGKLEFNFSTGKYVYSTDSSKVTADATKIFKVNISDVDGDKAQFDVDLKIDVTPNELVTTFKITSDADTIDLTTLINNNTSYKGVTDVIDMSNSSKINTLQIDMKDVTDLIDSDKQLVIKGDLHDKVDLDTTNVWANTGKEQLDGVNYKVYTGTGMNSTIKLLIEDEIDII